MAEPAVAAPAGPAGRRAGLRERIAEAGAAALVVSSRASVRWLTGFTGSAGMLVVGAETGDVLITDGRYDTQARAEVDAGVEVQISGDGPWTAAQERLAGSPRVLAESEHVSAAAWEEWREAEGPPLEGVRGWVEELRAVKSSAELEAIRRAAAVVSEAFEALLPSIRPGVDERELALEMDRLLIGHGSERPAFETIVAFGDHAAFPHARPGGRRLAGGEVVLVDCGAVVDGYCSDMTRTVAHGEPGAVMRAAYEVVLAAQRTAIEGIGPGKTGREADALARDVISAADLGPRFSHSLGHGIGLEVHERPRLSKKSDDRLLTGMVVTVEPGVYIAGSGGVRIEDDVILRPDGAEVLTHAPKETFRVL